MLTKCPECELQISDKALSCPHCGYPLVSTSYRRSTKKRMRLPNGFGQITEIKGKNLRNPFRAMITVGKTKNGKPVCRILKPQGYFKTYNEAYEALVNYNKNPYNLDLDLTMQELFVKWSESYYPKIKNTNIYDLCWRYCADIKEMRVRDIRVRHLKGCLEEGTNPNGDKATANIQKSMKTLFNLMLDYAIEYEIIEHNYARDFTLPKEIRAELNKPSESHNPFTDEEINTIWEYVELYPIARMIIIQCYMGWRPQELLKLKTEDININEQSMVGGMKTAAGRNRKVPYGEKIRGIVNSAYLDAVKHNQEYLFMNGIYNYTYAAYQKQFKRFLDKIGVDSSHKAHDPRKHFVTMAKKYNVDEYAIKMIVGHAINDLTERVYTNRDFAWLKSEIEKIL